jgi:hypothetical protein
MKRYGFLLALAFVILGNIVILAMVAYNRSGTPTSRLQLSARELPLVRHYAGGENSELRLRINWDRTATPAEQVLDRQKLEALGFDLSAPKERNRWRRREAYVVFEYQGKAWQRLLQYKRKALAESLKEARTDAQRKRLQDRYERFVKHASRLVLVDAGLDPAALRARYPERGHYLITRARIRAYAYYPAGKPPVIRGHISALLPATVAVPRAERALLLKGGAPIHTRHYTHYPTPPSDYTVTLAYGQRYEPWVEAIDKQSGD